MAPHGEIGAQCPAGYPSPSPRPGAAHAPICPIPGPGPGPGRPCQQKTRHGGRVASGPDPSSHQASQEPLHCGRILRRDLGPIFLLDLGNDGRNVGECPNRCLLLLVPALHLAGDRFPVLA